MQLSNVVIIFALVCYCSAPKQEEDMKIREKVLHNLRVKGAFGAQELYDKHRGMPDELQVYFVK